MAISKKVTIIDNNAFYQCERITSVEIPGSVKQIGGDEKKGAFCECADLEVSSFMWVWKKLR